MYNTFISDWSCNPILYLLPLYILSCTLMLLRFSALNRSPLMEEKKTTSKRSEDKKGNSSSSNSRSLKIMSRSEAVASDRWWQENQQSIIRQKRHQDLLMSHLGQKYPNKSEKLILGIRWVFNPISAFGWNFGISRWSRIRFWNFLSDKFCGKNFFDFFKLWHHLIFLIIETDWIELWRTPVSRSSTGESIVSCRRIGSLLLEGRELVAGGSGVGCWR